MKLKGLSIVASSAILGTVLFTGCGTEGDTTPDEIKTYSVSGKAVDGPLFNVKVEGLDSAGNVIENCNDTITDNTFGQYSLNCTQMPVAIKVSPIMDGNKSLGLDLGFDGVKGGDDINFTDSLYATVNDINNSNTNISPITNLVHLTKSSTLTSDLNNTFIYDVDSETAEGNITAIAEMVVGLKALGVDSDTAYKAIVLGADENATFNRFIDFTSESYSVNTKAINDALEAKGYPQADVSIIKAVKDVARKVAKEARELKRLKIAAKKGDATAEAALKTAETKLKATKVLANVIMAKIEEEALQSKADKENGIENTVKFEFDGADTFDVDNFITDAAVSAISTEITNAEANNDGKVVNLSTYATAIAKETTVLTTEALTTATSKVDVTATIEDKGEVIEEPTSSSSSTSELSSSSESSSSSVTSSVDTSSSEETSSSVSSTTTTSSSSSSIDETPSSSSDSSDSSLSDSSVSSDSSDSSDSSSSVPPFETKSIKFGSETAIDLNATNDFASYTLNTSKPTIDNFYDMTLSSALASNITTGDINISAKIIKGDELVRMDISGAENNGSVITFPSGTKIVVSQTELPKIGAFVGDSTGYTTELVTTTSTTDINLTALINALPNNSNIEDAKKALNEYLGYNGTYNVCLNITGLDYKIEGSVIVANGTSLPTDASSSVSSEANSSVSSDANSSSSLTISSSSSVSTSASGDEGTGGDEL